MACCSHLKTATFELLTLEQYNATWLLSHCARNSAIESSHGVSLVGSTSWLLDCLRPACEGTLRKRPVLTESAGEVLLVMLHGFRALYTSRSPVLERVFPLFCLCFRWSSHSLLRFSNISRLPSARDLQGATRVVTAVRLSPSLEPSAPAKKPDDISPSTYESFLLLPPPPQNTRSNRPSSFRPSLLALRV
jgi:hypothetical protein